MSAESAQRWLVETPQLDLSHPRLRITAQKLTQCRQTLAARAAALQDFVRRLPFHASADSSGLRASDVLARGSGDCHSKGVLFTALCRAAGLPARLEFVQVRTGFLRGILDEGPPAMPHAVGQVLVEGRWRRTDGYVVDPVLFAEAKRRLRSEGRDGGYGIVLDAVGCWDGRGDCLHQFHAGDVQHAWGVFDDAAHFHASGAAGERGWLAWLRYACGAQLVNHRVGQLRRPLPHPIAETP